MADVIMDSALPAAIRPGTSDKEIEAAAEHASRRRRNFVTFWRIAILAGFLAGWELASRLG
jgi:NitT/TauT family transport system permease protein